MDPDVVAPQATVTRIQPAADEEEPKRHSRYAVTISSNYRPVDSADQRRVEELFYKALSLAFQNDYVHMLKWNRGFRPQDIEDVRVGIAVETGSSPRGTRVHSHIDLDIHHKTNIALDYYRMKDVIMRRILEVGLGEDVVGLYINIHLIHNPIEAWLMYQKKKARLVQQQSRRHALAQLQAQASAASRPSGRGRGKRQP